MWILESEGGFFQGRRMWLKPGKQYLFGRVKKDGVRFAIDYKTVSRKHFVIAVDDVPDNDVGSTGARTKITITDQNSKAGTVINGDLVKNASRTLSHTENSIKPGNCPEAIVVRWQPFVLTFHLLKKELKAGMLRKKQERIRHLDIKAISEYLPGSTTHLVVNKRNTAKGLQALIDGSYMVAESYIDALEYAATPADLNEEENLSPLEQDFDHAWPKPADYLPHASKETTNRPPDSYRPDVRRNVIFEHFVFVFGDQSQYDSLMPPITTGHGKALLFSTKVGETKPQELIKFMQDAAGRKSFGPVRRGSDKGAVVLVQWSSDDDQGWVDDLITQVELKLNQRAIAQGDFLDAILANDPFLLRQAAPPLGSRSSPPAHTSTTTNRSATQQSQAQASNTESLQPVAQTQEPQADDRATARAPSILRSSPGSLSASDDGTQPTQTVRPVKRARFAASIRSRAMDFDDEFDSIPVNSGGESGALDNGPSQVQQDRHAGASEDMSDGEAVSGDVQQSSKRARPISQDASAGAGDDLDDLLPAAAAMKRRKVAQNSHVTEVDGTMVRATRKGGVVLPGSKSKHDRDIDIKEELRARREAEKENAKKKVTDIEDDMPHDGDELPVYQVRTETIDLPMRKLTVNETNGMNSDRWDPKWNGRKNFKAFRRAGTSSSSSASERRRSAHTRVIVPLVDAKLATYGIGDQYWEKSAEEKEREKEKRRRAAQKTQSQSQTQTNGRSSGTTRDDGDNGGSASEGVVSDIEDTSPELARLQQEAAEIMSHGVDVDEPRRTRATDRGATQTQTSSATANGHKRVASTTASRASAAKRQKTLPVQTVHGSGSESEDSDDMKFKFGRGRRRQAQT